MQFRLFHKSMAASAFSGLMIISGSGHAGVFVVDGTPENYSLLSEAVAAAVASGPGPHTINITTNTVAADTEVVISEPMTINGDADNDGTPCTIIVDAVTMTPDAWRTPGYGYTEPGTNSAAYTKTYMEFNTPGDVVVNDLKLLTNNPGGTSLARRRVNAVRMYKPMGTGEVGNYTLNNVQISGSDNDLNYVALDTAEDLYNNTVNRWPAGPSVSGAIVMMENLPEGALGTYNAGLNDCHVGLGQSAGVSVMNDNGSTVFNGGMFGHCGRDGITVDGPNVTITGSPTNRVRVVQCPFIDSNHHGIRVWVNGEIDLLEYADVMTTSAGVNFNVNGGAINEMRYCRGLGKADGFQNTMHVTGTGSVFSMKDCTLNGSGEHANPFQVALGFDGEVNIIDSIFTSENNGLIRNDNQDNIGLVMISYSAIASDGHTSESLGEPYITYTSEIPETMITDNITSDSPHYLLTAHDYDWSDDQGATQPGNGPGNINVFRPTNPVYLIANSTGGPLLGGAGPLPSRVDASMWMLMD